MFAHVISRPTSGLISIMTGTSSAGNSGEILMGTGEATAGFGGDVRLRVGIGHSESINDGTDEFDGGDVRIQAGETILVA